MVDPQDTMHMERYGLVWDPLDSKRSCLFSYTTKTAYVTNNTLAWLLGHKPHALRRYVIDKPWIAPEDNVRIQMDRVSRLHHAERLFPLSVLQQIANDWAERYEQGNVKEKFMKRLCERAKILGIPCKRLRTNDGFRIVENRNFILDSRRRTENACKFTVTAPCCVRMQCEMSQALSRLPRVYTSNAIERWADSWGSAVAFATAAAAVASERDTQRISSDSNTISVSPERLRAIPVSPESARVFADTRPSPDSGYSDDEELSPQMNTNGNGVKREIKEEDVDLAYDEEALMKHDVKDIYNMPVACNDSHEKASDNIQEDAKKMLSAFVECEEAHSEKTLFDSKFWYKWIFTPYVVPLLQFGRNGQWRFDIAKLLTLNPTTRVEKDVEQLRSICKINEHERPISPTCFACEGLLLLPRTEFIQIREDNKTKIYCFGEKCARRIEAILRIISSVLNLLKAVRAKNTQEMETKTRVLIVHLRSTVDDRTQAHCRYILDYRSGKE